MALVVLPAVTGLRGVAALAITLFHVEVLRRAVLGDGAHLPLLNHGWAAVDLFFALSAFLLGIPFLQAWGAHGRPPAKRPPEPAAPPPSPPRPSFRSYAWRRFTRVAPPYWASIPIALAINAAIGLPDATWRDLWTHALFVHSWHSSTIASINSVYWTLAVEAQFYLLLPALAWAVARGPAWVHLAWAAAVTVAVRWFALDVFAAGVLSVNLPGFTLHFVTGLLAARAWLARPQWAARDRAWTLAAAILLVVPLAVLVPPASFLQGRETWLANLLVRPALGLGFTLAILLCCRSPLASRVLGARPATWFGQVSYSLFLLHLPVLAAAATWQGVGWTGMALGLAAALAAAALFHAAVEAPAQRWAHRGPGRRADKDGGRRHGAEPL